MCRLARPDRRLAGCGRGGAGDDQLSDGAGKVLRLSDAGDAKPAWVTLLTTEHYNLQTQRAATISETNGRASIFLGATSAALVALGFQSGHGRSGATTAFQVIVLSALAFLGLVTFLRCLETAIDDWQFALRISGLRGLRPACARAVRSAPRCSRGGAVGRDAHPAPQRLQPLLTVAGSMCVLTSVLVGADVGVAVYGPTGHLVTALVAGSAAGLLALLAGLRFQTVRWRGMAGTTSSVPAGAPPAGDPADGKARAGGPVDRR